MGMGTNRYRHSATGSPTQLCEPCVAHNFPLVTTIPSSPAPKKALSSASTAVHTLSSHSVGELICSLTTVRGTPPPRAPALLPHSRCLDDSVPGTFHTYYLVNTRANRDFLRQ